MTNKKELLELAARAMGEKVPPLFYPDGAACLLSGQHWDPTEDDGDCARLEAAVKLDVVWHPRFVDVISTNPYVAVKEDYADHNDRQAARRLASTRAAAEVGRGMK
jgi:hypothetical protein